MKYPITLDALEVLDAIARKGSFAAAGNELFRVPSAISYTVQKLEQDLDVVLFRKEGRKAVLTQAGKVLLEHGREILEATERLAVATKKTHSGFSSLFSILQSTPS
jgi:DNA-binding transcriptional LysR family regulator